MRQSKYLLFDQPSKPAFPLLVGQRAPTFGATLLIKRMCQDWCCGRSGNSEFAVWLALRHGAAKTLVLGL